MCVCFGGTLFGWSSPKGHFVYACMYIYIYIYATPPPHPPEVPRFGLGSDVLRPRKQPGRIAQICTLGDQRKEVCLIEEKRLGRAHALFQWLFYTKFSSHVFPHNPCFFCSKALAQITHISSEKQCLVSLKDSSTENSHILSPNTCLFTCLLCMKQRQHM